MSRPSCVFATNSSVAFALESWLQTMAFYDEHYYPTLATIVSVDEKTKTAVQDLSKVGKYRNFINGGCMRKTIWVYDAKLIDTKKICSGRVIRQICQMGTYDLPR